MGKKVIPRFLGALVNFCKTDFLYLCITSMRKEDNGEKMGTGEENENENENNDGKSGQGWSWTLKCQ